MITFKKSKTFIFITDIGGFADVFEFCKKKGAAEPISALCIPSSHPLTVSTI